jgi:hypothetical protein
MARPKGVREKKKRKRDYGSMKELSPKSDGLHIIDRLTLPEQLVWNKYQRETGKEGGEALFNTPEQMMIGIISYLNWCEDNPVPNTTIYKDKKKNDSGKRRPYLLGHFCHYCGVTEAWFSRWKATIHNHPRFGKAIEFIQEACRTQQIEGGLINQFNPNLVMMLNGLYHKEEVVETKTVKSIPELKVYNIAPPLSSSEEEVEVVSTKLLNKTK